MSSNCIIQVGTNMYFGGWGVLGEYKIVPTENLAYRFPKILAERNLPKMKNHFGKPCKILTQAD